jgi:hypothetical protein
VVTVTAQAAAAWTTKKTEFRVERFCVPLRFKKARRESGAFFFAINPKPELRPRITRMTRIQSDRSLRRSLAR